MPAIGTTAFIRGIKDASIKLLTLDSSESLTYGTLYDIPTIQEISITKRILEEEQKGDGKIADIYTEFELIEFSVKNGRISLDNLSALTGATITAGGTTPSQSQTIDFTGSDSIPYFKLEGVAKYVNADSADVKDAHFILWKCKINSLSYALTTDGYASVSFGGKAIPTINDDKTDSIVFNETAAAIA